ncbi:outer membrane protein [Helicobacter cetorum]|uniref:Putative outer membrane protein n=1 Tax=Helicobacter cetorum (strain ATCC BAA-429 / MIT 00-7128) TaxID=182217 RepID=I0ELG6_HELC0|nr:outer membrane protein [Helicobacter cetorum]AFI03785.1 putative outer membrane protein [Helicobacter cetorum MIT 00-7128]
MKTKSITKSMAILSLLNSLLMAEENGFYGELGWIYSHQEYSQNTKTLIPEKVILATNPNGTIPNPFPNEKPLPPSTDTTCTSANSTDCINGESIATQINSLDSLITTLYDLENASKGSGTNGKYQNYNFSSNLLTQNIKTAVQDIINLHNFANNKQDLPYNGANNLSALLANASNAVGVVASYLNKEANAPFSQQIPLQNAPIGTPISVSPKEQAKQVVLSNASSVANNAQNYLNGIISQIQATAQKASIIPTTIPSISSSSSLGNGGPGYGLNVQFGYKWFFGKKKHFGVRTYGTYSYLYSNLQHKNQFKQDIASVGMVGQANNSIYGAGIDFLWNFWEGEGKNQYRTAGILLGTELLGSSWSNENQSYFESQMKYINAHNGHAKMNTSYFQIPVVVGFRANLSKHNGLEFGLKIPLAYNSYFKSHYNGTETTIVYKNLVQFYVNYVVNF